MAPITHRSAQVLDPLLTNLGRKYTPVGDFLAERLCPRVGVNFESGKYVVWNREDFARIDVDPLLPDRTEAKEVDFGQTTENYSCEEYALRVSVSEREVNNSQNVLDLRQTKVNGVQDIVALHREKRVADLLTETGGLSAGDAPSNNWDQDAATIEQDVLLGKETVKDNTGVRPNTIVIPWKVANRIALQQDIRELFKYTVNGRELLAVGESGLPSQIWGLNVLVADAPAFTTSAEGAASTTYVDPWGDDVRILYVTSGPSLYRPSVAYTLQTRGFRVYTYNETDPNVERIVVSDGILDEKITAPGAGYEIQNVLS